MTNKSSERIEEGDIIEIDLATGPHLAIYLGRDFIVHSIKDEDSDKNVIDIDKIPKIEQRKDCRKKNKDSFFNSAYKPEEVIARAFFEVGKTTTESNEAFAYNCRYGTNIKLYLICIMTVFAGIVFSNKDIREKVRVTFHNFLPIICNALLILLFILLLTCVMTHRPGEVYLESNIL